MTHRERESQQQEKESDIEESEEEGEFWVTGVPRDRGGLFIFEHQH